MRFCQKVKIIMEQTGIGQNELARKANLSSSGISAALNESGNPRESTMIAIYDALGLSPSEFWNDGIAIESLNHQQAELINLFEQLNDAGQSLLISQAESILQQPALRKKDSTRSAM